MTDNPDGTTADSDGFAGPARGLLAVELLAAAHDALCAAGADLTLALHVLDVAGARDALVLARAVEYEAEAVAAARERASRSAKEEAPSAGPETPAW